MNLCHIVIFYMHVTNILDVLVKIDYLIWVPCDMLTSNKLTNT